MAYHDALMDGESGLSKAEREMIVVATSGANHCLYCVVAHGAILRIRAKEATIADKLATNYRQAALSVRQQAMLDYAMKVSQQAAQLTALDRQTAMDAGLSIEDLWDITSIAAFFCHEQSPRKRHRIDAQRRVLQHGQVVVFRLWHLRHQTTDHSVNRFSKVDSVLWFSAVVQHFHPLLHNLGFSLQTLYVRRELLLGRCLTQLTLYVG